MLGPRRRLSDSNSSIPERGVCGRRPTAVHPPPFPGTLTHPRLDKGVDGLCPRRDGFALVAVIQQRNGLMDHNAKPRAPRPLNRHGLQDASELQGQTHAGGKGHDQDGGSAEKPVGLVWFALADPSGAVETHRLTFPGQRGDEIVTVEVVIPTLGDERSREIMRELAKLNNQDPRVALFDKL